MKYELNVMKVAGLVLIGLGVSNDLWLDLVCRSQTTNSKKGSKIGIHKALKGLGSQAWVGSKFIKANSHQIGLKPVFLRILQPDTQSQS